MNSYRRVSLNAILVQLPITQKPQKASTCRLNRHWVRRGPRGQGLPIHAPANIHHLAVSLYMPLMGLTFASSFSDAAAIPHWVSAMWPQPLPRLPIIGRGPVIFRESVNIVFSKPLNPLSIVSTYDIMSWSVIRRTRACSLSNSLDGGVTIKYSVHTCRSCVEIALVRKRSIISIKEEVRRRVDSRVLFVCSMIWSQILTVVCT